MKITVHVCCAVCGAALVDYLKEKYDPEIFFFNPNVYPREEYEKRKEAVKKLAKISNVPFIEGEYDNNKWLERVKGLEKEKEGGKRCDVCFKMRLEEAAKRGLFTSTLALSPHKNEETIEKLGKELGEYLSIKDLSIDKKAFWQKTRELARKNNFYHQKYCGCQFAC